MVRPISSSGPKRVLFVVHRPGLGGGAEQATLELMTALRADGRVTPCATVPSDGPFARALEERGIAYAVAHTAWWAVAPEAFGRRPWRVARRAKNIAAVAKRTPEWRAVVGRLEPDVIVTTSSVVSSGAWASLLARVPHVWWLQEFVVDDHELEFALGRRVSTWLMRLSAAGMIANSQAVLSQFTTKRSPAHRDVAPYGIEGYSPVPLSAHGGPLRLLLLGFQVPTKGCDEAIAALALARTHGADAVIRLVGGGDTGYKQHLRDLADRLGVGGHVEVLDATDEVVSALGWADALLMCSRSEAFGRVTAEALKSGRTVIGKRSGGTPELVEDEFDGLLYSPGRTDEFAHHIKRLATEPGLLEHLSANAAVRNANRFTLSDEVERFVAMFDAVTR